MKAILNQRFLWLLLCLFLLTPQLHAQETIGFGDGINNEMNVFLEGGFSTWRSLFYYSDVGVQNSDGQNDYSRAVLLAANSAGDSSMMFTTEEMVYIVGNDTNVYISRTLSDLTDADLGTYTGSNTLKVEAPGVGTNANLSLFLIPLQEDDSEARWIMVKGIGSIIIDDIDPTTKKSVLIPNETIFGIQTTASSGCGYSGNHMISITW